jgi:hypothetical protein
MYSAQAYTVMQRLVTTQAKDEILKQLRVMRENRDYLK